MTKLATKPNMRSPSFNDSIAGRIFSYVRGKIISTELEPGEMISETQLAKQFGVSRTPVREALSRLSVLGLVEIKPQRGTFISKLNMKKILGSRFIREAIETAVVCVLAENPPDELIVACEDILLQQEEAAKACNPLQFQQLDDKFHYTLANFTGFERVTPVIETENAHLDRIRALSLIELSGQYDEVILQHRAILTAIKNGSVEQAKTAMSAHMKDIFNTLKVVPIHHPDYFDDT